MDANSKSRLRNISERRNIEQMRRVLLAMTKVPDAMIASSIKERIDENGHKRYEILFKHHFEDLFPENDGRVRKLTPVGTTWGSAQVLAREALLDLNARADRLLFKRAPKFADFAPDWWKYYVLNGGKEQKPEPATIRQQHCHLTAHAIPWFEDYHLDDITYEVLLEFKSELLCEGDLCSSSVRNILGTMRMLLKHALKSGALEHFPVFPKVKTGGRKHDFFRFHEKEHFLETIDDRFLKTFVLFMLETGVRPGEALALRPTDFNFRTRKVHVERSFSRHASLLDSPSLNPGDGFPTAPGFKSTKTGPDRWVPLTSRVIQAIRENCDMSGELVFPGYSLRTLRHRFKEAVNSAGIGRDLRLYDTRHTYASLLGIRGATAEYIGKWLGHTDPKTTRIYTHIEPEEDDTLMALTGCETEVDLVELAFAYRRKEVHQTDGVAAASATQHMIEVQQ